MKIINMICPNCGASLQIDADKKAPSCNYCGSSLFQNNGVQNLQYGNPQGISYQVPNDRQSINIATNQHPKKNRIWLWVLGWIFIFPVPLTILLLRNKTLDKKIQYGGIAAAWVVFLLIGCVGGSNRGNSDHNTTAPTNDRSIVIEDDTNETSDSQSNDSVKAKIDSNILEIKFIRDNLEIKAGNSNSSSYVTVKVKKEDLFSTDDIIFVSDNPEIATIEFDHDALTTFLYYNLCGIAPGETYVYAKSKDGAVESEHIKVTVQGDKLASGSTENNSGDNISEISFIRSSFEIVEGKSDSSNIRVDVKDRNAFSPDDIVFVSDNPEIATIEFDRDALTTYLYYNLYGIAPGETYVYAKSKDGAVESEHIKVTVKDDGLVDPESITILEDKKVLAAGESYKLTVNATPENASIKKIRWSSSDDNVISVDESGRVSAIGGGTATITAEISPEIKATCELTVDNALRIMLVSVKHPRDDDINIGHEWSYTNTINSEPVSSSISLRVGDTINVYSKYTESDDNPDIGEAAASHYVTAEDLQNGFDISMDLYVTENGGRNSGQSAHFIVTYTFTAQ